MDFLMAFVSIISLGISYGAVSEARLKEMPQGHHLDLEMTGPEYARLWAQHKASLTDDPDAAKLQPVLDFGQRNLQWLTFINQHRDQAHQISLTSEANEHAYPIEKASEYNVTTVLASFEDLKKTLPPSMAQVLLKGGAFTPNPPMSDADYITWGLKADMVYQIGTRWLLLKPYLDEYIDNRKNDIRGYYFLNKETGLPAKLAAWSQLDGATQKQYYAWLISSCGNQDTIANCTQELDSVIAAHGNVQAFFDKYHQTSEDLFNSYFVIQWPRTDINWTSTDPSTLHLGFIDPQDAGVKSYLKDNIEDEWKWTNWNLRLDMQASGALAHVTFQPGVTPHVDLPDTIVMDKNQPFTEYDARWTIRHEFGHVMGFPDCYVEYYDQDRSIMVSYQIDITNLMCSRRGKFKQVHFDELKKTYFR